MKKAKTKKLVRVEPAKLTKFGPRVLLSPGEPWFVKPSLKRPTSVWSAAVALKQADEEAWRMVARDLFQLPTRKGAKLLLPEAILFMAAETGLVEDHGATLAVWIDPEGRYKLKVWKVQEVKR